METINLKDYSQSKKRKKEVVLYNGYPFTLSTKEFDLDTLIRQILATHCRALSTDGMIFKDEIFYAVFHLDGELYDEHPGKKSDLAEFSNIYGSLLSQDRVYIEILGLSDTKHRVRIINSPKHLHVDYIIDYTLPRSVELVNISYLRIKYNMGPEWFGKDLKIIPPNLKPYEKLIDWEDAHFHQMVKDHLKEYIKECYSVENTSWLDNLPDNVLNMF